MEYDPRNLKERQPLARFLIVLFRQFEEELIKKMKKAGFEDLHGYHLNVIRHISTKGSRPTEIAQDAGLSKQAIGKTIQELEEKGYLERSKDGRDGRAWMICFSPKGMKMLEATIQIVERMERRYVEILGEANYLSVKSSLAGLINHHQSPRR